MFDAKTVQAAIDALAGGDGNAALDILKALLTAAASGGAMPAGAEPTAESAAVAEEQKAFAALARDLMTLSASATPGDVAQWARTIKAQADALAADRAALEAGERLSLVAALVTLKAETPATAWARDAAGNIPEGDARKPVKRLADEPIAELRDRVKQMRASAPVGDGEH